MHRALRLCLVVLAFILAFHATPTVQRSLLLPTDNACVATQTNYTGLVGYVQDLLAHNTVDGWVATLQYRFIADLSQLQLNSCITGAVGEIGVHHGKFFIGLAFASSETEPKVAVDLFSLQQKNLDKSGVGDLQMFSGHLNNYGIDMSKVTIIESSSLTLSPVDFTSRGLPPFRLLSVDGGHYYSAVLSDLRLAALTIHPAGVVVVDDFFRGDWIGVGEGVLDFLATRQLAPFLWGCNKIYLSTPEYHDFYYSHFSSLPYTECLGGALFHSSRYTMRGWKVCVSAKDCSFF
jgi:hypothetical protein